MNLEEELYQIDNQRNLENEGLNLDEIKEENDIYEYFDIDIAPKGLDKKYHKYWFVGATEEDLKNAYIEDQIRIKYKESCRETNTLSFTTLKHMK